MEAGGRAGGRDELGTTLQGLRGQPPPGGSTGVGVGTRGRAEMGCAAWGRGGQQGERGGGGRRAWGQAGRGWSCCFSFEHGEDF